MIPFQTIIFSILVFLAAFIIFPFVNNPSENFEFEIYNEFLRHIPDKKYDNSNCRVAIGYNTNLDLIVPYDEFFDSLIDSLQRPDSSLEQLFSSVSHNDVLAVDSVEDLISSFGYFFTKGSAAERFVSNENIWKEKILPAAFNKKKISKSQIDIGGNGMLMAQKISNEGCHVLIGGAVGLKLTNLIQNFKFPENLEIIPQNGEENGENFTEEVHLIIEYPTDASIGKSFSNAPRANRYIISNDLTNSQIKVANFFHKELEKNNENPFKLVILTGFHLMEREPKEWRIQKLSKMKQEIKTKISLKTFIHFELASISNFNFSRELFEIFLDSTSSLGLNEQELYTLYKWAEGDKFKIEDFKDPNIQTVEESFLKIIKKIISRRGIEVSKNFHQLFRIHFHCLKFHSVFIFHPSSFKEEFKIFSEKMVPSVISGSLTASNQACDFSDFESVQVAFLETKDSYIFKNENIIYQKNETLIFKKDKENYFYNVYMNFVPVLTCVKVKRTVGLGDAISSSGLLAQFF